MTFGRRTLALTALAVTWLTAAAAAQITQPFSGNNQKASVSQWIGPVEVTVDYSGPRVHSPTGEDRKGKIWGGLVPYGLYDLGFNDCTHCPWRAGSNENTVVTVSHDVLVQGKKLPAGRYGLFIIADPKEWTVIFSRNSTSWGAFTYDPAEDVLRVPATPAADEYHEWLTYDFTERLPDRATLELRWENLRLPIHIEVEHIEDLYVAQMRRELRNREGYSTSNWITASQYCLTHKTHLEDGLWFAKQAAFWPGVGIANFETLSNLAQLQIAVGQRDSASRTLARAMAGDPDPLLVHQLGRGLQAQGENALAMEVFQANAKHHPNQWPVNVGLARGYAGLKDFPRAAQYAQKALAQAPDSLNKANLRTLIQQWKSPPTGK